MVATMRRTMQEPTYFTLAALLDGPLHGYAIISRVVELSEGQFRLTAGTLYGALERLATEGLIEATGQEIVDGRARRYYRLTGAGHNALQVEAARLDQAASVVRRRVGLTVSLQEAR
jgi:PadR family transcriptional regulator, regulatory protein PadR